MMKFTYEYEELPFEDELINLKAEVAVDPYDSSEWCFEEIELSKYNEDQDDWYILRVKSITDPLMRAVHHLFKTDYKLRFDLEEEINEHVDGIRDSMLEQMGKDRARGLQ